MDLTTKTYHLIDSNEVEKLIKQTYKITDDLNLSKSEGWKTHASYTYDSIHKNFGAAIQGEIDEFLSGQADIPELEVFLVDLCNKDVLKTGNYLVQVK